MSVAVVHDRAIWDAFVETSPDKLLYFQWDFLKIIEKHSEYTLLPYGVFDDRTKELLSIFPLFYYKKWGIKFIFSQPPRSLIPYMGFLMNPGYYSLRQRDRETMLNHVVQGIHQEISAVSPNYVSLSFGPRVRDIRPFLWRGYDAGITYTYTIDLIRPADTIWNLFDKKCRAKIRSAEKHTIRIQETHDAPTFCSIIDERYRQQGLKFPFYGADYLMDILAAFPRNVKMYFLYEDTRIIDLAINYEYHDRIVLWMGGISKDKTIPSNEFSVWEFIKSAKADGLKILEIQGADIKRLCEFKSKFNPQLESNFTVRKKDFIGKSSELIYLKFLKRA